MSTIFIGSDHRGLGLKNKLIEYLQEQNIRVEDLGPYEFNKDDDAADYSRKVTQAVLQNPQFKGIVICGSGAAVDIAANRIKGIRCSLGFDVKQVEHMRGWDDINILALASDFISIEKASELVDAYMNTPFKAEERMVRRIKKFDEDEQS